MGYDVKTKNLLHLFFPFSSEYLKILHFPFHFPPSLPPYLPSLPPFLPPSLPLSFSFPECSDAPECSGKLPFKLLSKRKLPLNLKLKRFLIPDSEMTGTVSQVWPVRRLQLGLWAGLVGCMWAGLVGCIWAGLVGGTVCIGVIIQLDYNTQHLSV